MKKKKTNLSKYLFICVRMGYEIIATEQKRVDIYANCSEKFTHLLALFVVTSLVKKRSSFVSRFFSQSMRCENANAQQFH